MQNNTKCCKTKTLYITNYLLFTQTYKIRQNICCSPSLSARPRSKKVSRNRYLLFLYLWRKFTCRRRCGNKRCRLAAFAQWACKGPCGKQKGKALSGATIGSVVANSPSPLDHNAERTTLGSSVLFFLCFYGREKATAITYNDS